MPSITFEERELSYEINEELKQLRTNIQFSGDDNRVIMMTSAASGEGKSSTALELCRSMAELGKMVLLLDVDMRKSVLYDKTVGGDRYYKGLSHLLSGQADIDEVLYETDAEGMYVIFAGRTPPNPSELLSSNRMKKLIELLKKQFDYIIMDCPPINMVADASVVAPLCDAAIVIIKADAIPRKVAQMVIKQVERTGCPILGVVLNQVNVRKHGYYYGGYYKKYGYGYYQSDSGEKGKKKHSGRKR